MNVILMQIALPEVLVPIVTFILGICLTAIVYKMLSRTRAKSFKQDQQRQIEGAKREAENIIKSAQIDAAAETIKNKEQFALENRKCPNEKCCSYNARIAKFCARCGAKLS